MSFDTINTLNRYVNDNLNKKIKINMNYEGWNFNSGNYLFTTDTK